VVLSDFLIYTLLAPKHRRSHGATILALHTFHLPSATNSARPMSCFDIPFAADNNFYITVHKKHSQLIGRHDPNNATLFEAYIFEIKYVACWKIYTRGFDNSFREDLMQINLACAQLDEPSEDDLLELINVMEVLNKVYVKYLESDTDRIIHDEQCFDRLEHMCEYVF
jgi:hypothetical protein